MFYEDRPIAAKDLYGTAKISLCGDFHVPTGLHIVVDPSKCSGCRYCELWCSYKHEGVFSTSLSRIRVVKDDIIGLDYPVVCKHCSDAPCIASCQVKALYKDENGLIKLNEEDCIGCGKCVKACPYGAVFYHPMKKTPLICDLCGGDPICVAKCPTNALSIHPLVRINVSTAKVFDKTYLHALNEYKSLLKRWGVDAK